MEHAMGTHRLVVPAVLAVLAAGRVGFADTVMYVDATASAGGDGGGWETAHRFLSEALAAAIDAGGAVELRVAGGTYVPDRAETAPLGSGDRFAAFRLASGVRVRGGYAGVAGGGDPDVRDPETFVTILSGDLAGDDLPGFVNNEENSHHVVIASGVDGTARLEGLTITAGHADGHVDPACFGGPRHGLPCEVSGECPDGACVSLDSTGAGLLAVSGSPWLVNCRVVDNFALFQGAGMMLKAGSDLVAVDCEFRGNRALDNGGALYMGASRPVFMRCDFVANSGGRYAGASCNRDHSDAQFIDCDFIGNTAAEATDTGGGAIVNASSSPTFTGCTFTGNRSIAGKGGAFYSKLGFDPDLGPSRAHVIDCVFEGNEAALFGGAVYDEEGSETTIARCGFIGNVADRGGAIYTTGGGATVVDASMLRTNHAVDRGGAVYNDAGAATTLTGSTLESNTTAGGGGALYSSGTTELIACTVRSNTAEERGGGLYSDDGTMTVTGGAIELNRAIEENGGGIYNYFRAVLTVDGVRFEANQSDGDGGGIYAPGAASVELAFVRGCTFHANVSGYHGGGLYGALEVSDTVFHQNVADANGGGYYATNGSLAFDVTDCLFEGNIANDGAGMYLGTGGFGEPVTIAGCVFRDNYASDRNGGGLEVTNTPLTLVGSTFDGNDCGARGGGLSITGGSIVAIDGCVLVANTAAGNGGGMRLAGNSVAAVTNCDFEANDALFAGGVYVNESALTITGCRIMGNTAAVWGGGLYAAFSDFEMTNCTVAGNLAVGRGGGLHLFRSNPAITSTAIVENAADETGAGIFNEIEAYPVVSNCILWGNRTGGGSDEAAQITDRNGSRSSVHYSCVEGWTGGLGGEGNIGADPQLVDARGPDGVAGTIDDDLRLAPGSPSIDAADNDVVPAGVEIDLAGNPRFVDDPDTVDTGRGAPPVTDMGPYEFPAETCPADADGDGDVGFGDVLLVLTAWGDPGGPADIDGSGEVGFGDVLAVLAQWGSCP